jgi:hypothetical protein
MANTENMSNLMHHHADTTPKYTLIIDLILFIAAKSFIIPSEWKHSGSSLDAGKSKNEVPLIFWIKVIKTNSKHAKSICREFWLQMS